MAVTVNLTKVGTLPHDTAKLQQNVDNSLQAMKDSINKELAATNTLLASTTEKTGPIANGVTVQSVTLPATGSFATVKHGLGRIPTGYHIIRQNSQFTIFQDPADPTPTTPTVNPANPDAKNYIRLQSSSATPQTLDLWVF